MKKLFLVLMIIGIAVFSCDSPSTEPIEPIGCVKPVDIPDTLVTGEKVDWDCNWQASYNAGNVHVIRDNNGGAKMIYRSR
ncbi:MAG: hypothetical protein ACFFKA_00060 [Candidatus Thorarchaeota archaeon]